MQSAATQAQPATQAQQELDHLNQFCLPPSAPAHWLWGQDVELEHLLEDGGVLQEWP